MIPLIRSMVRWRSNMVLIRSIGCLVRMTVVVTRSKVEMTRSMVQSHCRYARVVDLSESWVQPVTASTNFVFHAWAATALSTVTW